jgi:hypothetical protein
MALGDSSSLQYTTAAGGQKAEQQLLSVMAMAFNQWKLGRQGRERLGQFVQYKERKVGLLLARTSREFRSYLETAWSS